MKCLLLANLKLLILFFFSLGQHALQDGQHALAQAFK